MQNKKSDILTVIDGISDLKDGIKAITCIGDSLDQTVGAYHTDALNFVVNTMKSKIDSIEKAFAVLQGIDGKSE